MKKNNFRILLLAMLLLVGVSFTAPLTAKAADTGATAVSIGCIDYENLTMRVFFNGNNRIYFSMTDNTDLSAWDEVSGERMTIADLDDEAADDGKEFLLVDISWASPVAETSFYLRGDCNTTAVKVELPKQVSTFRVSFDKVNGTFTFDGKEDAKYFWYRKSTDYNWIKVSFDETTADGSIKQSKFLEDTQIFRFKGAKLVFRLGQVMGTAAGSMGSRPSKDVTVSISKYATAPSVKINITKLTLNTKTTMEYTNDIASSWYPCEKNMELSDLTSGAEYFYGTKPLASAVTLYFRVAKTDRKPASQIAVIQVPAQNQKPTVTNAGNADINYEYNEDKSKLLLTFNNATKDTPYEYCIIPDGSDVEFCKAKWKTVKNTKTITLTAKAADEADIYFRVKGINANASKNIDMQLPSRCEHLLANGFIIEEK